MARKKVAEKIIKRSGRKATPKKAPVKSKAPVVKAKKPTQSNTSNRKRMNEQRSRPYTAKNAPTKKNPYGDGRKSIEEMNKISKELADDPAVRSGKPKKARAGTKPKAAAKPKAPAAKKPTTPRKASAGTTPKKPAVKKLAVTKTATKTSVAPKRKPSGQMRRAAALGATAAGLGAGAIALSDRKGKDKGTKAPVAPTGTYKIKRGDTLSQLAKKHGTTVKALMDANGIKNANRIYAGRQLKIPANAPKSTNPYMGMKNVKAGYKKGGSLKKKR